MVFGSSPLLEAPRSVKEALLQAMIQLNVERRPIRKSEEEGFDQGNGVVDDNVKNLARSSRAEMEA